MAWSKVDDRLFAHPKVLAAGVAAMGLWVVSLSYAACYKTDGIVPASAIQALASNLALLPSASPSTSASLLADKLVEVGLWERTEQGFRFHDWEQYNPSKVTNNNETAGKRMSRAEAGRLGGLKRQANKQALGASKELAVLGSNASSKTSPVPDPVPDPVPISPSSEGANILPVETAPSEPPPEEPEREGEKEQPTPPPAQPEPAPAPEIALGSKVSTILDRYSNGVLTKLDLTNGQLYQLGMVALDLKEKHGIDHTGWRALADWIAPSGPGFKNSALKSKPSWSLLLSKDGALMRTSLKEALEWHKTRGVYNGR